MFRVAIAASAVSAVLASVPFSWKDCGSGSDPVQLTALSETPYPIAFGKNITVTASASSSAPVTPVTADVVIHKKVAGIWTKIPCLCQGINCVGSCTYPKTQAANQSLCYAIEQACPQLEPLKIPCKCPLAPTKLDVNALSVLLPVIPSWISWLSDGDYEVEANVYDGSNNRLVCVSLEASLSK